MLLTQGNPVLSSRQGVTKAIVKVLALEAEKEARCMRSYSAMSVVRDLEFMQRPMKDTGGTRRHSNKNERQWQHSFFAVIFFVRTTVHCARYCCRSNWPIFNEERRVVCVVFYILVAPLGNT